MPHGTTIFTSIWVIFWLATVCASDSALSLEGCWDSAGRYHLTSLTLVPFYVNVIETFETFRACFVFKRPVPDSWRQNACFLFGFWLSGMLRTVPLATVTIPTILDVFQLIYFRTKLIRRGGWMVDGPCLLSVRPQGQCTLK